MSKKRHSPDFKAKVALEALRGVKPLHLIASEAGIHPLQIAQWKIRALDNIFVERLWRSIKYEEVYLHDYQSGIDAWSNLDAYFQFYCNERPHQAWDYKIPESIYFPENKIKSP